MEAMCLLFYLFLLFTHTDCKRVGMIRVFVCLFFPHDMSKNDKPMQLVGPITELDIDMFYDIW